MAKYTLFVKIYKNKNKFIIAIIKNALTFELLPKALKKALRFKPGLFTIMNNSTKEDRKITLHVMIEGGRSFSEEYVPNQKIQVLINKALENLNLNDAEKRQLIKGDGTQIIDFKQTIAELSLNDNETLKFILKSAPKPDEPKKFAS